MLKVLEVPLFSGFMYAAVGSYTARMIRIFDMAFTPYPPVNWAKLGSWYLLLCVAFVTVTLVSRRALGPRADLASAARPPSAARQPEG